MLTEVWRAARLALAPAIARIDSQQHRIELVTGGVLEMWSLDNPDAPRGRKYRRIVVDEAAMIPNLGEVWQAVIRPTLVDYAGDAWFLSTPRGRNFFATMFDWGNDPAREDWRSWSMPTLSNPHIPAAEVEAARRELPERIYAQEFLAAFLDDAGGVFRRVTECATAVALERGHRGHQYVYGVDWGKHSDFTVISVLGMDGRQVAQDRFNQIDYRTQVNRLAGMVARFPPALIVAERNSMGDPLVEELQRRGWPVAPFTTTNASKANAIDALALAFERGDIAILPDPTLIAELQAFESTRLPSGMLRYAAPEGLHDDCVMALAIGWQGLAGPVDEQVVYDERVSISPF